MRRYERLLVLSLLSFLLIINAPHSEYWFQSGVRAGLSAAQNSGASVQIQTVVPQGVNSGSLAFWVGENLPNGAFLQAGYVIENESGYYPTDCTLTGCSGRELLLAGNASWFYEYFPPQENSTFLGSVGPNGSAGQNGTFNTYGFYSRGGSWYFFFNNQTVGSANLGSSTSGGEWPVALGEVANTSGAYGYMADVLFANLSVFKKGTLMPVASGYGTIGYGAGSRTDISNPYGVQEVGDRVNYFEVGSNVTKSNNNTRLWSLGFKLNIDSPYGNISSKNSYVAYSAVPISAPKTVYLNRTARVVFKKWSGSGAGSYTGTNESVMVTMNGNITETANWQIQYLVNVSSPYGYTQGSGWYNGTTMAQYSINTGTVLQAGVPRLVFSVWNNGNTRLNGSVSVNGPVTIIAGWNFIEKLLATNEYNEPINVTSFTVDGKQTNNTVYLDANESHLIEGAYYDGIRFPVNMSVNVSSPSAVYVHLPVINVSIKTVDYFGLPLSVPLTIEYKNGTQVNVSSGSDGTLIIPNVPYGYAKVDGRYLGQSKETIAGAGAQATLHFLSIPNIALIIIIALIITYSMIKIHSKKGARKTYVWEW